ncbi:FIST signal transduction protein [Mucilaginibacter psychrotolerans]|uniref:Histidine kinase n=1 Tax=Mucilaginibacter psychrotolerans TaxID=1524096 RepID=A0A4Y8SCF7_9SPHI|nr:FIST N-terminal domain-containing protein [Mucilaginibacter psychrotolerans]TFF36719.1 histidine kinase [Mucilaginibacter psychrotolerans]
MKTQQHHFVNDRWVDMPSGLVPEKSQLVLVFGSPAVISHPEILSHLRSIYLNSDIVFSSTAGEILGEGVYDDSAVATAIEFEKTRIKSIKTNIKHHANSFDTGLFLMQQLSADDLNCVFVISDGTFINGSELVSGLNKDNKHQVPVTGGLAGDAARFEKTLTGLNEAPAQGNVIAIGFYGGDIRIGHGSVGGWDEFGPERTITRSNQNILFEIDNKNALDLYKEYLGDYVDELPGSALLFPLSLRHNDGHNVVRTILNINEEQKSMTFAGNLPEGSKVRLMKANFDKIIEASSKAANFAGIEASTPDLAVLISCVGRKLILQERTFEELEAAKEILGDAAAITGFYSYGEISPFNDSVQCELHNQTMTITTFTEL